jgi:hypothetical protein
MVFFFLRSFIRLLVTRFLPSRDSCIDKLTELSRDELAELSRDELAELSRDELAELAGLAGLAGLALVEVLNLGVLIGVPDADGLDLSGVLLSVRGDSL